MPSTSAKQAKFMRAVAHSPKFAKKVGVPQSVGKDFEMADKKKMRKFASAGSVGRKATEQAMTGVEDILKSAPSLVAAAQSDKSAESAMKAAATPKKAPSFAEAFRAARAAGDKTFTWGGKSFAAKMAGEGASRPATTRSSTPAAIRSSTPAASTASASPATSRAQMEAKRTAARSQEAIRDKRAENQADFRERMQAKRAAESRGPVNAGRSEGFLSRMFKGDAAANYAKSQEKKYGKSSGRPLLLVGEEARKANKGTIGGYAKGGKIDGCAIRGKTRAIKKGK